MARKEDSVPLTSPCTISKKRKRKEDPSTPPSLATTPKKRKGDSSLTTLATITKKMFASLATISKTRQRKEDPSPLISVCHMAKKRPREETAEVEHPNKKMGCEKVLGNEQSSSWFIPSVLRISVSGPEDTREDCEEPMPSSSGGLRRGRSFRRSWFRPRYSYSDSD